MGTCPACATAVSDAFRFCPACGGSLDVSDHPTHTAPRRPPSATASPSPGGRTPTSTRASGAGGARPGERFPPGTVLLERYRSVALLGRGGMGEVYRADDLKLEQPVALKFLPRALEGDPDRLERLYAEVCRVWDVGEAAGQHFLSMELVDGENLASLPTRPIQEAGRPPRPSRSSPWSSSWRWRPSGPPLRAAPGGGTSPPTPLPPRPPDAPHGTFLGPRAYSSQEARCSHARLPRLRHPPRPLGAVLPGLRLRRRHRRQPD